ncbi:MAG: hypothetical protein AAGA48_19055 [Myxococcota bacterium]
MRAMRLIGMAGWLWGMGCGPLHEADYVGESLFTLEGQVRSTGEMEWVLGPASADLPITVGLFWARRGLPSIQQDVRVSTRFPAHYELELLLPPPEDALLDVAWAPKGPVAIGLPLLYLDEDGDGWLSEDEPLVGNAAGIHVLYAEAEGLVGSSYRPVPIHEGFQRVGAGDTACEVDGIPRGLSLVPNQIPTDLLVGPAFTQLIDIDCDGTSDEWDICPEGPELQEWCTFARYVGLKHSCLEECGYR